MYRYMNSARPGGARNTSEVLPQSQASSPRMQRTAPMQLDYATWHASLRGNTRAIFTTLELVDGQYRVMSLPVQVSKAA